MRVHQRSVLVVTFCLGSTVASEAKSQAVSLTVPASASVKSELLQLGDTEQFRLQVDSRPDAEPVVVPYVYDQSGTLVCKDDPDVTAEAFTCRPPAAGTYYFVVQNVSAFPATVRVFRERVRPGEAPKAEFATVRVFFATTRAAAKGGFGAQHSDRTSYGHADVSVPRDHRMGELEGPTIWRLEWRPRPEKHIMLLSLNTADKVAFFRSISQKVGHTPNQEVLVFVHGFNVSFEDGTRRAAQITYDLGFSGAPVLFSWPSHAEGTPLAYQRDERNADLSAEYLFGFVDDLSRAAPNTRIHIIAHSMGNRVLAGALQRLNQASAAGAGPRLEQVALVAPDIDAELFRQVAPRIAATARRVTLYASADDLPIRLSGAQAGARRAGQGGQDIVVVPGIDTIDASAVRTSILGLMHAYYADNSSVLADLFALIRGRPPQERFGLTAITSSRGMFWRFRPSAR